MTPRIQPSFAARATALALSTFVTAAVFGAVDHLATEPGLPAGSLLAHTPAQQLAAPSAQGATAAATTRSTSPTAATAAAAAQG